MLKKIFHSIYLDIKLLQYFGIQWLNFAIKKYLSKIFYKKSWKILWHTFFIENSSDISFLNELIIDQIYLKKYIPNKWLVIDSWANIWQFAFLAKHILWSRSIYSFEPLPDIYDILKKNNNNSFNIWIGDTKTTCILYYWKSTLTASAFKCACTTHEMLVNIDRLEDNVDISTKIDLLKIDTEWSEYTILKSISNDFLKKCDYILVECSWWKRHNTWSIELVITHLFSLGFIIAHIWNINKDQEWMPAIVDILFKYPYQEC